MAITPQQFMECLQNTTVPDTLLEMGLPNGVKVVEVEPPIVPTAKGFSIMLSNGQRVLIRIYVGPPPRESWTSI